MAGPSPDLSGLLSAYLKDHRLRLQLLSLVAARDATPTELARALGTSPQRVRYHLRKLVALGLVERVAEQSRRGVVEGSYTVVPEHLFDDREIEALSPADQLRFVGALLSQIRGDVFASLRGGLINERPERSIVRFPMRVDEQGWAELLRIHAEALDRARRVSVSSAERLAEGGDEPIVALSVQLCIELPKTLEPRGRPNVAKPDLDR